jgi:uncharacterized protein (TIGR02246 family)
MFDSRKYFCKTSITCRERPLQGETLKTKTYVVVAIACLSLQGVPAAQAQAPRHSPTSRSHQRSEAGPRAEIKDVLKSYQRALNASDVAGVVRLYTDDAVVLAPGAPSAVGSDAVREAYRGIFQALDIDLTFEIAEVKVVSPDWAFLRSTSHGTITVLANGGHLPSSNQELFVLQKSHGHWKLARYSFSSVLPS